MSAVKVPGILYQLAHAGEEGIPLPEDAKLLRDLELLRSRGFPLQVTGDRAYLVRDEDIMVPAWIEEETPAIVWEKLKVVGFLEMGSTNEEALEQARSGAPSGLVVYAETQTSGRGRLGRAWFSPPRAGIYLSIVLRPSQPVMLWPLLALAASVALACALREFSYEWGIKPLAIDLKWPNDVLISGKKTAGILLETARVGRDTLAAVVGCGINLSAGSVPADLADRATAVGLEAGVHVPRRWLAVRFLYHFQIAWDLFERGEHNTILMRWKNLSTMWNGMPIWVIEGDRRRPAVTCGLSNNGALRVRTEDGSEKDLLAGDVSVRSER